jgi:uncharacterized membrane protein YccC
LLEVTLGGTVAVIVSFVIFPERAHRLAAEAAARILDEMAKDLPDILAGFLQRADATELQRIQDRIGGMVSDLQGLAEEIKRERPISFTAPDPDPLPRTLLRLRHDLVMMGRASLEPPPDHLRETLRPALGRIGMVVASYFRTCGIALTSRHMPPPLQPLQDALATCAAEVTASRQTELAQLSPSQLEQLFALGFALEQFQRNIKDLERCIQEWVPTPRPVPSARKAN